MQVIRGRIVGKSGVARGPIYGKAFSTHTIEETEFISATSDCDDAIVALFSRSVHSEEYVLSPAQLAFSGKFALPFFHITDVFLSFG